MLVKIYTTVNNDNYIKVNIEEVELLYLIINGFRSTHNNGSYKALLGIDDNGILELYNYDNYIE